MLEEMLVTQRLGFLCLHAKVQLLISPLCTSQRQQHVSGKAGIFQINPLIPGLSAPTCLPAKCNCEVMWKSELGASPDSSYWADLGGRSSAWKFV